MQASIHVSSQPAVQYLLRIGDTCLILAPAPRRMVRPRADARGGHRPRQHGARPGRPGARRAHARRRARRRAAAHDEDQLAFLRDERDFRNLHAGRAAARRLRRDRCCATLRWPTFLKLLWTRLARSSDAELAGHRRQGGEGGALPPAACGRLGRAPRRRHRRIARRAWRRRSTQLWPYVAEIFESDAVDDAGRRRAASARAGPTCATTGAPRCGAVARRGRPARCRPSAPFRSTGKRGVHSEHMGYILAEMQHLQRAFPEACGERSAWSRRALERGLGTCSARVLDPEVPVVSVRDLGIVRDVIERRRRRSTSCVTPTYSGCPATEVIEQSVRRRARRRRPRPGARRRCAARRPGPPTGSATKAARKLREYGIAPPGPVDRRRARAAALRAARRRALACPRCEQPATPSASSRLRLAPPARRSYRCLRLRASRFEHFKPI